VALAQKHPESLSSTNQSKKKSRQAHLSLPLLTVIRMMKKVLDNYPSLTDKQLKTAFLTWIT
jgi:hypothetical protein